MSLPITQTLKTLSDLQTVIVDGVKMAKDAAAGGFGSWAKLFTDVMGVASDVRSVVTDAPGALPELKDVDAAEAGQIATAAYDLVKAVVAAVVAA